ncbi:MAG TPA: zinc ABC transporter substrate-binding protein [Solirubrobacteraceae bacterium]|nr:zinc ABC transporter substrate-binding protein [Solirubrobacteraceae bacterium]
MHWNRPLPRTRALLRRAAGIAGSLVGLIAAAAVLAGCGSSLAKAQPGKILAVGAENQYANVISQIGGRYVQVAAVMSNPNTDPHTFEASPAIAQEVGRAELVVQNGLGYDDFMAKIESATSGSDRKVIDVQSLERLPDSTPNPHLWYRPETMPLVAHALAAELIKLQPSHAGYFRANEARFDRSMWSLRAALKRFHAAHPHVAVATTEPVADYLLQAAGIRNLTPFSMQADIMNGTDPAPQAISAQNGLFAHHRVQAFVYNRQVTDSITNDFLTQAHDAGVPVVGVYETMPSPGYDYQSWMMAELHALQRAVVDDRSTTTL